MKAAAIAKNSKNVVPPAVYVEAVFDVDNAASQQRHEREIRKFRQTRRKIYEMGTRKAD